MSYPEEGSPMDPSEHESHNLPQATEHYAGDVLPITPNTKPSSATNNTDNVDMSMAHRMWQNAPKLSNKLGQSK